MMQNSLHDSVAPMTASTSGLSAMYSSAMPAAGAAQSNAIRYDARSLEIKTQSIEQTLVPLVQQITTLVNHKERLMGKPRTEKSSRAALKIGNAVQSAVERFVTVGETIADENPDIQPEMYEACHEARTAGSTIANINSFANDMTHAAVMENGYTSEGQTIKVQQHSNAQQLAMDKALLVRAARQLLSSVTRVLLLADKVLVKQILKAEDKVFYSLSRLEATNNFTEFVKIFTQFGGEMVELAHRSGDRQNDLKSEKRRAQMAVARSLLERYTMLLLTASKTLLRHPECTSARETRDGVFRQMRFALQLIGLCVCDGVLPFDVARFGGNPLLGTGAIADEEPLDIGLQLTANAAIKQLLDTLEMVRITGGNVAVGVRERLSQAINSVGDMTQDFTDSAYTPHHHREQILDFLEECRFEVSNLMRPELQQAENLRNEGIEVTVQRLNRRLKDLRKQLQIVAMDLVAEVFRNNEDHLILQSIKACSVGGDIDGVEQYIDKFREHAEHMQEMCRLLHHISLSDALHVSTGHAERTLRALAPLVIQSGRTLCLHPSSRMARENLEVFCDVWAQSVNDLSKLAKDSDAAVHGRVAAEKQAYMSLPRPGKHGSTHKTVKPTMLDVEEKQKMAKVGLEMKLLTSEVDAEAEKWDEYAENDIVKRAKSMSSMAYNMYLFTRGDGPLKTTHDLFTQAEFFAEEANKMYKTVREFSYEVPGSAEKSDLLAVLEKIPVHCQQLQVLVKSPTVGKTATFNKVDSVIQETKNLMNEIAKLVTSCFVCATKTAGGSKLSFMTSVVDTHLPTVNSHTTSTLAHRFHATAAPAVAEKTPYGVARRRCDDQPLVAASFVNRPTSCPDRRSIELRNAYSQHNLHNDAHNTAITGLEQPRHITSSYTGVGGSNSNDLVSNEVMRSIVTKTPSQNKLLKTVSQEESTELCMLAGHTPSAECDHDARVMRKVGFSSTLPQALPPRSDEEKRNASLARCKSPPRSLPPVLHDPARHGGKTSNDNQRKKLGLFGFRKRTQEATVPNAPKRM